MKSLLPISSKSDRSLKSAYLYIHVVEEAETTANKMFLGKVETDSNSLARSALEQIRNCH